MTEIERKALELVNEVARSRQQVTWECIDREFCLEEALCRAIEQHEAFRQEVSDAVESLCNTTFVYEEYLDMRDMLRRRFIITKPDPLVDVIAELGMFPAGKDNADQLRAALAKRGLEIREKHDG